MNGIPETGWRSMIPTMWECKDSADGWIRYFNEVEAEAYQRDTGCAMRVTFLQPGTTISSIPLPSTD